MRCIIPEQGIFFLLITLILLGACVYRADHLIQRFALTHFRFLFRDPGISPQGLLSWGSSKRSRHSRFQDKLFGLVTYSGLWL